MVKQGLTEVLSTKENSIISGARTSWFEHVKRDKVKQYQKLEIIYEAVISDISNDTMRLETLPFMSPPAEQSTLLFSVSYSLVPMKFFLLKAPAAFLNSMESDVRLRTVY